MVNVPALASWTYKARKMWDNKGARKAIESENDLERGSSKNEPNEPRNFSDYDYTTDSSHDYGICIKRSKESKIKNHCQRELKVYVANMELREMNLYKNVGLLESYAVEKTYWLSETEAVIISRVPDREEAIQKVLRINHDKDYVNMRFTRKYRNFFRIDYYLPGELILNDFEYVSLGFSLQKEQSIDKIRINWVVLPKDPRVAPRVDRLVVRLPEKLDSSNVDTFLKNMSFCSETQLLRVSNITKDNLGDRYHKDLISFNLKNIQHFKPCNYLIDLSILECL